MSTARLPRPDTTALLHGALVANTLLAAALVYVLLTPADLRPVRYSLYGTVWVGVGGVVLYRESRRSWTVDSRVRRVALALAGGYLVALALAGGVVVPGGAPGALDAGWFVRALPPGWGPALVYGGHEVALVLMPARVAGYLALAALVRGTALDAAAAGDGLLRGGAPGLLALFSCVSCALPLLLGAVSLVFGAGSALAAATASLSYDLSTLVFLLTVGLLYWNPFVG